MKQIDLEPRSLEDYRPLVGDRLVEELYAQSAQLQGVRVAHINATAAGGGVAEILRSIVPLYQTLGIDASWWVMDGSEPFFQVTKQMHNALQGAEREFSPEQWALYQSHNEAAAASIADDYDVIVVHDPQPAAIMRYARLRARRWVWRCHIDTSRPHGRTWSAFRETVAGYDAAIFSVADFVAPGLDVSQVAIIPPAIDPLTPKNLPMDVDEARAFVASHGVDVERPFISQISRFDPWKDPLGVIACFKRLKQRHPDLQLVLLGNFADDDPEGQVIFEQVRAAADGVPDISIITGLSDMVNPFQMLSRVVLQKSIREGFGLTVTEALWKGTPVVAGNVGGLRLQLPKGIGGFLVDSVDECAARVDYLLSHDEERQALGASGREHVRTHFLMPRLLRDELKLIGEVLGLPIGFPVSARPGDTSALAAG